MSHAKVFEQHEVAPRVPPLPVVCARLFWRRGPRAVQPGDRALSPSEDLLVVRKEDQHQAKRVLPYAPRTYGRSLNRDLGDRWQPSCRNDQGLPCRDGGRWWPGGGSRPPSLPPGLDHQRSSKEPDAPPRVRRTKDRAPLRARGETPAGRSPHRAQWPARSGSRRPKSHLIHRASRKSLSSRTDAKRPSGAKTMWSSSSISIPFP